MPNPCSGTGFHVGSRWAYCDTSRRLGGLLLEVRQRPGGGGGEAQWAAEGLRLGDG